MHASCYTLTSLRLQTLPRAMYLTTRSRQEEILHPTYTGHFGTQERLCCYGAERSYSIHILFRKFSDSRHPSHSTSTAAVGSWGLVENVLGQKNKFDGSIVTLAPSHSTTDTEIVRSHVPSARTAVPATMTCKIWTRGCSGEQTAPTCRVVVATIQPALLSFHTGSPRHQHEDVACGFINDDSLPDPLPPQSSTWAFSSSTGGRDEGIPTRYRTQVQQNRQTTPHEHRRQHTHPPLPQHDRVFDKPQIGRLAQNVCPSRRLWNQYFSLLFFSPADKEDGKTRTDYNRCTYHTTPGIYNKTHTH